ncbi:MAG TPA: hypothetical protein VIE41_07625 [Methylomirabilota bacterium]|jgi:hypothetical protein
MSIESGIAMMMVFVPFAVVLGLLRLSRMIHEKREAGVARQIALTDAIHRELGAVVAPVVKRSWTRGWIVSVRVPLHRAGTVSTITRITHDLFSRLDREDPPRLHLVLIPREVRPWERAQMIGSPRPATRLGRAA